MASGIDSAFLKNKFRQKLFETQNGMCYYCKRKMSFRRKKNGQPARDFATFEHLLPRRLGGQVNYTNIVLACLICNYQADYRLQQNAH